MWVLINYVFSLSLEVMWYFVLFSFLKVMKTLGTQSPILTYPAEKVTLACYTCLYLMFGTIKTCSWVRKTFALSQPYYIEQYYSHSPHYSLHISYSANKDILFDHQELLKLVIISFNLMTFTLNFRKIMSRELRRQSLLGIKGSSQYNTGLLNLDQKLTQRWILTDQLKMKNRKDLENSKAVCSISSDLQGGHKFGFFRPTKGSTREAWREWEWQIMHRWGLNSHCTSCPTPFQCVYLCLAEICRKSNISSTASWNLSQPKLFYIVLETN